MICATKRKQKNNQWRSLASLGLMLALGLLANSTANAQALDGAAIQKLALQGTWVAEHAEFGNWSWGADNTVCFRLANPIGDCADTGTWTINGDVMCYELTWWGESVGNRTNCFTVNALGDGRYEALYHGGAMISTFIHFGVPN
jgi:hypothetical protein